MNIDPLRRGAMIAVAGAVLAIASLAGCDAIDAVKNGFDDSQAVSADLEKSLGLKSQVGFNWHNGQLTSVNVVFQGLPGKGRSLEDIAEQSREAVSRHFRQEPKQLVISFSVPPVAPQASK